MLVKLITNIVQNFYKTKWVHQLPKKKANKPLQKSFKNWTIVKGDIVKVITGDDRGKIGKVVKVLRKLNRIVVKGVNIRQYTRQQKEGQKVKLKRAGSIHISNVGLYDKSIKKAVKVRTGYHPQTGKKFRVSKKSGAIIYKTKTTRHRRQIRGKKRIIGLKDTPRILVEKVTYSGQDFDAIKRQFQKFIAEKQQRQKHLVFAQ